jgi:hypothetical protein
LVAIGSTVILQNSLWVAVEQQKVVNGYREFNFRVTTQVAATRPTRDGKNGLLSVNYFRE